MTGPDIQYFAESGTWRKPAGAVRVDMLLCAAGAGGAIQFDGADAGRPGRHGELRAVSRLAAELPETVEVEIGRGGRGAEWGGVKAGDGGAGYALILTHLARGTQGGQP